MTNGKDFYRLKFEFLGENAQGRLFPEKEESLVLATNYSDAECIAAQLMVDMKAYSTNVKYEIVKTKITEILLSKLFEINKENVKGLVQYLLPADSEEAAIFAVNVIYKEESEEGKEKTSKDDIYVAANSPTEAIAFVTSFLSKVETRDWKIRNVKMEKAVNICVDPEMYGSHLRTQEEIGL